MSLTLIAGPTSEPVSLAEAKDHCRIDATHDDALISRLILTARQHVETYTRRALLTQTWDQTADALGAELVLERPPVQSVTSVKYLDTSGAEQTLAPSQYRLVKRATGEFVIVPAYGVQWPAAQPVESSVTVRFVAGYATTATVPEPLRHALLLLVGHWYEQRSAVDDRGSAAEVPFGYEPLVFPFRAF
jgi:uncharacterized phiE125 gp8 family phage protein